jgi:NodT family efflux transporter outer membrane factor (OMF) lipoprotein
MNTKKILLNVLIINLLTVNLPVFSFGHKDPAFIDYKKEYINQDWWERFNDPVLTDYIMQAAEKNHDIKINSLKVLEENERVKEAFGKQLPSISFEPTAFRRKYSGNLPMGRYTFPSYTQNNFMMPMNVNYELDIWGKNRTNTKMVKKQFEAIKYQEKAEFISLTSSVASVYFNILNIDKQIQIQKQLVDIRKEILDLMTENYNNGLASATEITLAEKSYTEALSDLDNLQKNQNTLLNQMSVLIGSSSNNSISLQRSSLDKIEPLDNLPETILSQIIDQRPDILKAEAELQAAALDVKMAKKAFFPSINLSGIVGFNAHSMSSLFDWPSFIMAGTTGIVQPLYSGGQNKARLKMRKYKYEQLIENYQKTILTSVQEINDSLVSIKFDTNRNNNNLKRIKLEESNLQNIDYKYKAGAISYLDTLQHKETLLVIQKDQCQSKTDCLIDSISLYKSAGGANLIDISSKNL